MIHATSAGHEGQRIRRSHEEIAALLEEYRSSEPSHQSFAGHDGAAPPPPPYTY